MARDSSVASSNWHVCLHGYDDDDDDDENEDVEWEKREENRFPSRG